MVGDWLGNAADASARAARALRRTTAIPNHFHGCIRRLFANSVPQTSPPPRSEFEKKGVFSALPGLTIRAPEAENFQEDLILPSLADSNTASLTGIVGAHQYEFGPWNVMSYAPTPFSNSIAAGKRIWVTEWNTSAFKAETPLARATPRASDPNRSHDRER